MSQPDFSDVDRLLARQRREAKSAERARAHRQPPAWALWVVRKLQRLSRRLRPATGIRVVPLSPSQRDKIQRDYIKVLPSIKAALDSHSSSLLLAPNSSSQEASHGSS